MAGLGNWAKHLPGEGFKTRIELLDLLNAGFPSG